MVQIGHKYFLLFSKETMRPNASADTEPLTTPAH
jgi:hypothetical protein